MTAVILLGLLVVVAALAVAWPLVRRAEATDVVAQADPAALRRLELRERRDEALAALLELDLDHRTGKIADADYERARAELRATAAAAIEALDSP